MDWERRCKELQLRVDELERENQDLRRKLGYPENIFPPVQEMQQNDPCLKSAAASADVHMKSTPEEKIRLFRNLFHNFIGPIEDDVVTKRERFKTSI